MGVYKIPFPRNQIFLLYRLQSASTTTETDWWILNDTEIALHISGIAVVSSIAIPETVSLSSFQFQVSHNTSSLSLVVVWLNYIHFGPQSLRSSVSSVLLWRTELTEDRSDRGPKWMCRWVLRAEMTEDRSDWGPNWMFRSVLDFVHIIEVTHETLLFSL